MKWTGRVEWTHEVHGFLDELIASKRHRRPFSQANAEARALTYAAIDRARYRHTREGHGSPSKLAGGSDRAVST